MQKNFDARIRKILLKQVDVEEAEQAGRMTSLLQNYEWAEYMTGDFLRAKQVPKIISTLTQDEFRKWAQDTFNKTKMIHTAVVPAGLAKPCTELAQSVLANSSEEKIHE